MKWQENLCQKILLTAMGVEVLFDAADYFSTRDLTLNEALANDTSITVTKACLLDSVRRIIRLTEYEQREFEGAGPKMLSKILRFYAESIHRYGEGNIGSVESYEFERYFINPFWLSLQLDRACSIGTSVAEVYVDELKKRGQLPGKITSVAEAASYLASIMGQRGTSFYYRYAPTEQFHAEAEWFESTFDKKNKHKKKK